MVCLILPALLLSSLFSGPASAIDLDVSSEDSIRNAAAAIAEGIFSYYSNDQVANTSIDWQIGLFPEPYYWWESGAVWGGMIDYWAYTNDTTYLQWTLDALNAQTGPNNDFVMPEQYYDEANDDQAFWTFNALSAVEYGFPSLPCSGSSVSGDCSNSYLALATNTFNDFVQRWNSPNDSSTCGGGLKWQYTPTQAGYDYKNSVSNGGFFQVAARLARYTGNQTYADWADRVWDWCHDIGLITGDFQVYDGTDDTTNCTGLDRIEWTYNSAIFLYGAAAMYNATNASDLWAERVNGLVDTAARIFFSPFANATGVMFEQACEVSHLCNTDQASFKAYLSRWMAKSAILAPPIVARVTALLTESSLAAAHSCTGGVNGTACGTSWWVGGFDGKTGLGQQLSALETVQSLLIGNAPAPMMAASDEISSSTSAPSCPNDDGTIYTVDKTHVFLVRCDQDYRGSDLTMVGADSLGECIDSCVQTLGCVAVAFQAGHPGPCWLKSAAAKSIAAPGVSGAALVLGPAR